MGRFGYVAAVLMLVWSAEAQQIEGSAVKGIVVDVTGASAAEARSKAMALAQRRGVEAIARGMPEGPSPASIAQIPDAQLDAVVQDIEIQNEKNSAVRYIGTLSIRFNIEGVKALLARTPQQPTPLPVAAQGEVAKTEGAADTPKVDVPKRVSKTVVIPVYSVGGQSTLWEENNPWRQAWNNTKTLDSKAIVVPMGDLIDGRDLSLDNALAGDVGAIDKLRGRYGADGLMVVVYRSETPPTLDLYAYTREGLLDATEGEKLTAASYDAGITRALAYRARLEQETVSTGQPQTLSVRVRLASHKDWLDAQGRLAQVRGISKTDVTRLNRSEADVTLAHTTSNRAILARLKQAGFVIEEQPKSGRTLLSLDSAPQQAPAPQEVPA